MSNVALRNFAGGEISPALYGRVDLQKYATGLRTCRNFVIRRHGGAANRAGTEYVASAKYGSSAARLLRFVFNTTSVSNVYVLELGDRYLRFHQAGAPVTVAGVAAWVTGTAYKVGDLTSQGGTNYYCTTAHTSGPSTQPGVGSSWQSDWHALTGTVYELPTPYKAADLFGIRSVQTGDVVTLTHPSYPPLELQRYGHTDWLLSGITFGPATPSPTNIAVSGGLAGPKDIWWAVTAIDAVTGEESLAAIHSETTHVPDAGTPATVTWNPVANASSYRIYRSTDGATFGLITLALGGQPTAKAYSTWSTATNTITTTTQGPQQSAGQARIQPVSVTTDRAVDGNYTIQGSMVVSIAGADAGSTVEGYITAYYSRDGEPRVSAGNIADTRILGASGSATVPINGTISVPDNGYTTLVIDLVPTVWGGSSKPGASFTCEVDETGSPNAVSWKTATQTFSDTNATPDYSQGPPSEPSLFASPGNYPTAVGAYQQRRLFANTDNQPDMVWGSRIGSLRSFATSFPLRDDDRVSWQLVGHEVNAVEHLMDLGQLLVFTSDGVWAPMGDVAGALLPTAINPRQVGFNGVGLLAPVRIVDTAIYYETPGAVVRDLVKGLPEFRLYQQTQMYDQSDLTVFARHLFDDYDLVDWEYERVPDSVLWAVRADGVLLGLTYIHGQQIAAWHRHDTDGVIESVTCVPEGREHRVYLVVRRTINGATVRYVERMASRHVTDATDIRDAIFTDCTLTYDGRNTGTETMTLSGGPAWDETITLTLTRSVGGFTAGDVGTQLQLTAADGVTVVRFTIEGVTSGTVVTGHVDKTIPADLQGAATTAWARAVKTVTGLAALEGKAVSILGDGYVVSSPNRALHEPDFPALTVAGGSLTMPAAYAVVRVGLPYLCDLETLDIDAPEGQSMKDKSINVTRVGAQLEHSRGFFAGQAPDPAGADPLDGLEEARTRNNENWSTPPALTTDFIWADVVGDWGQRGRVFVRHVDPLPLTVCSLVPAGYLPVGG